MTTTNLILGARDVVLLIWNASLCSRLRRAGKLLDRFYEGYQAARRGAVMTDKTCRAWAILWRQSNKLDGHIEQLVGDLSSPVGIRLFKRRYDARLHVKQRYGFIANSRDLRAEPLGWKIPRVVRVEVTIRTVE